MKNGLILFFTLVYFTFSIGTTLKLHYCGGEIEDVQYSFADTKSKSNCCGEEESEDSDCCQNVIHSLKIKDNHSASKSFLIKAAELDVLPAFIVSNELFLAHCGFSLKQPSPHPPPEQKLSTPTYLLNRVFRL